MAQVDESKVMDHQQAVDDELQNIIRDISHDLRTPLVSAHGFSQLLIKYCESLSKLIDNPDFKEYFDKKTSETIKYDIPQSVNYISESLKEMDELIVGLKDIPRTGKLVSDK